MKRPVILLMFAIFFLSACSDRLSKHGVIKSTLGTPVSSAQMLASMENRGPIVFEKILSMEQYSKRSEQIILDEEAIQAGIEDADETINIYFYAIRHPTKGLFLIDSGMPENYSDHFSFVAKKITADMKFKLIQTTHAWIKSLEGEEIKGIFLTHLHFDHAMGVAATPNDTPIYVGPNDGTQQDFSNRFLGGPTDSALSGKPLLRELYFVAGPTGPFQGILDVFGDGSFYAILTPDHTPGSLAYLLKTTEGPQLITGDTARTRLEWTIDAKPIWFAEGKEAAQARSAKVLKDFVSQHKEIDVHLGHQSLTRTGSK